MAAAFGLHVLTDRELVFTLVAIAAVLLAVPSVAVALLQAGRARPRRGARSAAWLCFFAGQLGLLHTFAAWACLEMGRDWWARGARAAALVYGLAAAMLIAPHAVHAVRLVAIGVRSLRIDTATWAPVRVALTRMRWRAIGGLATFAAFLFVAFRFVPMPGREWVPAIYVAFTFVPATLACAVTVLATWGASWRLRRAASPRA